MALLVVTFEFFRGLVEGNLRRLGLRHLMLKFLCLTGNFDGELLDLKCKLFDLGLIGAAIFFKSKVVLFFLAGCEGPLLQLLLVPVHL